MPNPDNKPTSIKLGKLKKRILTAAIRRKITMGKWVRLASEKMLKEDEKLHG